MKKLVVIKIGTSLLTTEKGTIKSSFIADVCEDVAKITAQGWKVIIVSSGAMASGRGIVDKSGDSPMDRSMLSTIGQPVLMHYYIEFLRLQNLVAAQCLLTWNNFNNEKEKNILRENFIQMLSNNIIPIVNENDFISREELRDGMGDNDTLSAKVAGLLGAEKLLILSDVDGLYTANPQQDTNAKKIDEVKEMNEKIWGYIGDKTSKNSLGGMKSKIEAAELATTKGVEVTIFKGRLGGYNIPKILLEKQSIGTKFLAQ